MCQIPLCICHSMSMSTMVATRNWSWIATTVQKDDSRNTRMICSLTQNQKSSSCVVFGWSDAVHCVPAGALATVELTNKPRQHGTKLARSSP